MPNHVINNISLRGDPKKIRLLLETVKSDKIGAGSIDFNKVIPMPESLNIETSSRTDQGLKAYRDFIEAYTVGHTEECADISVKSEEIFLHQRTDIRRDVWELGKTAWNNIKQYGAATWFDWRVSNWGTKWNAYGYGENTSGCHKEDMLSFQTAWSAPYPVLERLSEMFPDIEMEHEWANEDISQNCGRHRYKGGKRIEEYFPATPKEAIEFACKMWGYSPAELDLCLNTEGKKYINVENEEYQQIELLGKSALFTNDRLTDADIPQGLYCCHLRRSDDGMRFCSAEPRVTVNHGGSVITKEPLDFGKAGYISLTEDAEPNFTGEEQTLGEFLRSDKLRESEEEGMGGMRL